MGPDLYACTEEGYSSGSGHAWHTNRQPGQERASSVSHHKPEEKAAKPAAKPEKKAAAKKPAAKNRDKEKLTRYINEDFSPEAHEEHEVKI